MDRPEQVFEEFRSLVDRDAYEFYKQNRRRVSPGINEYNLYKKTVRGLFAELARMLSSAQGGIYIAGLGYFCYVVSPTKRKKRKGSLMQRLKKKYVYTPYFFPDEDFKDFTMDGAFYRMLHKRKYQDEAYKLHFDLCESHREAMRLQNILTDYKLYI